MIAENACSRSTIWDAFLYHNLNSCSYRISASPPPVIENAASSARHMDVVVRQNRSNIGDTREREDTMEEKSDPDNGNQNSDIPLTGGCLCGAVRYESSEPPVDVAYCHCRKCQRAYGNPFGVFAFISAAAFKITRGEPKYSRSSAWAERGFCADCGTPLVFRDSTQNIGLLISTLDHPADWPPTLCHSGMESRIEWDGIADDLPRWRTRTVRPPGKAPLLDMVRQHDQHLVRQHDQRRPPFSNSCFELL